MIKAISTTEKIPLISTNIKSISTTKQIENDLAIPTQFTQKPSTQKPSIPLNFRKVQPK